jgi:hypothetical protein
MASLDTKNAKNNRNMREKYSFMSSHKIWRWFHPRDCKKSVKPSAKPRVLPLFATLGWNHLIFHGYSWKSLIIFHRTKIIFVHVCTEFNFVDRIHFCVTKFTFVRQNSILSCQRSYSLLFYVNHSPIGCNAWIFGEGKPRLSRAQLGCKSTIVTWLDI